MSKKCKKEARLKKLAKKRNIKIANRAMYDSFRDSGQNSKSKRYRKKGKKFNTISHPEGLCGNIGCYRCNPMDYNKPVIINITVVK